MGLWRNLLAWLFGSGTRANELAPTGNVAANAGSAPVEADCPESSPAPANRKVRRKRPSGDRPRLRRLRYRSSLVKTAGVSTGRERPYRYAERNPRTGAWLNLTTDSDPRWIEYYNLPALATLEQLADWLEMPLGRVLWLSHRFSSRHRPATVREAHYHWHWLPKKSGGWRLIEAPKPHLKHAQERILRGILDHVPAHAAAHGFVAGRSALSNARPHVGQRLILKFDLENFYPSVRYNRVVAIFRSLGFSREIGITLARLTTSCVPWDVQLPGAAGQPLRAFPQARLYAGRHLPQGAPTSPALANLSAYGLDVRLAGLARRFDSVYTRYADDLTFSGSRRFAGSLREFIPFAQQIIRDEQFRAHRRKRKVLRTSQRQSVTGIVVNVRCNIARDEYDLLKATLHNCHRHGPSGQNRDQLPDFAAHLRGRVAHVRHVHPARGDRLLRLFEQIDWSR